MENIWGLAAAGCVVSAAAVFVLMQFKRYEEQQQANDRILKATAEFEAVKAKLAGYTKFNDYLAQARQHLIDQAKSNTVHVVREYVHMERFYRDKHKLKADVAVIGKYTVEFSMAVDIKADSLELAVDGVGLNVKTSQPILTAAPAIKSSSHEVSVPGVLTEEKPIFAEVNQKFSEAVQRYGLAVAREDTVRALSKTKIVDGLRDFLSKQPGVRQLPSISVTFR